MFRVPRISLRSFVTLSLSLASFVSPNRALAGDAASTESGPRRELLASICSRVRAEYIDAAKGERIGSALEAAEVAGRYATLAGEALADTLTKDMRTACPDTHLGLMYSEEVIPLDAGDDAARPPESEESRARRRAEWAHANYGFLRVERWPGNVGFLDLDSFVDPSLAGTTAAAAMQFLSNADAIVIDLRYNPGGHGGMVALLASYFLGEEQVHLNDYHWRASDETKQSWSLAWLPGPRLTEQPLFLVTGPRTHSAAEEFCYDLQVLGRAKVVGTRTKGGAHPVARYRLNDHYGLMLPIGMAINPTTGTNWEGVGVQPDVAIDPDRALDQARLLALEAIAARAKDAERRAELESLAAELRGPVSGAQK